MRARWSSILLFSVLATFLLYVTLGVPLWSPAQAQRTAPAPAGSKGFELRAARQEDGNDLVIRFKPTTGESWLAGLWWHKVEDRKDLPAGDYDVAIVTGKGRAKAYRIERGSGTTWRLDADKRRWLVIDEPDK